MKRNAEQGTYNGEPTYCPVNCWNENDCPYARNGICHIDDPMEDCSDWGTFWDSWEEWEDAGELDEQELEETHEWANEQYDIEIGFDPYAGCYTYDC